VLSTGNSWDLFSCYYFNFQIQVQAMEKHIKKKKQNKIISFHIISDKKKKTTKQENREKLWNINDDVFL